MDDDTDGGRPAFVEATPVGPDEFYLLYQGVLEADDPETFYRDAALVLGVGRLGLRPDTLLHLHDGWIDWGRGTITVPEHDPCTCSRCVERVREREGVTDPSRLGTLCPREQWRPLDDRGARTIPFAWSERLTCVLLESVDRFEVLDLADPERRLATVAARAPGLDPDAVSVPSLRAGAAATFADLGLDRDRLREVVGADSAASVDRFVRQAGRFGRGEPLVPSGTFRARYRVVGDPTPFPEEFADPTEYGADRRGRRARRDGTSSSPVTNPRPSDESVDADPLSVSETVDFLDLDDELVSIERDSIESFAHAWVRRHDPRESGDSEPVRVYGQGQSPDPPSAGSPGTFDPGRGATSGETPGTDGGWADVPPSDSAGDRSPGPSVAEQPPADEGRSPPDADAAEDSGPENERAPPDATSESGGAPTDETADSQDGSRTDQSEPSADVTLLHAPPSEAVGSPVESYTVRYVSPRLTGSTPATGTLVLDRDRLVLDVSDARASGESLLVGLGALLDFTFEYDPDVRSEFEGVGLAVEWDGDRETLGLVFEGSQADFAADLLATVFEGREAVVSYPVRRGGRVNRDVRPRRSRLDFEGGRLLLSAADDGDAVVEVDLAAVTAAGKSSQEYRGSTVPSVELTFTVDGASKTARIGFRNRRLAKLFSRLSRAHHYRQRERIRRLSLDASEKEFLITLHSMVEDGAEGVDVGELLDLGDGDFTTVVGRLKRNDLIEMSDGGAELTDLGRTVVNEKIDDVNV